MKQKLFLFFIFLVPFYVFSAPLHLEDICGKDFSIFKTCDADMFLVPGNQLWTYFNWTSGRRESARYPGYSNSPRNLQFAELPLSEVIFYFSERSLTKIYISVYNRGDDGLISPEAFAELVSKLSKHINLLSKRSFVEKKGRYDRENESRMRVWTTAELSFVLRWNISKVERGRKSQGEFIQLDISNLKSAERITANQSVTRVSRKRLKSRAELQQNIVRQKNHTVFLDGIPMVDQGDKGYCAAALTERLLKYFGNSEVSQHTIAQLANISASHGTDQEQLMQVFQNSGRKLGIKLEKSYELFPDSQSLERFVKQYNSLAKKQKLPAKRFPKLGLFLFFTSMDRGIYLQLRNNQERERSAFYRNTCRRIDQGYPVIWSVFFGMVPEPGVPAGSVGGHLRLIIGYNKHNNSIIYSDTWGNGHEKKEMSLQQAWQITMSSYHAKPW